MTVLLKDLGGPTSLNSCSRSMLRKVDGQCDDFNEAEIGRRPLCCGNQAEIHFL